MSSSKAKTILLDTLSTKSLVASALGLLSSLFILVVVGAYGPKAAAQAEYPVTSSCAVPTNCTVTVALALPDLSPYNQATWLTARMKRPTLRSTGTPALPSSLIQWTQAYTVAVTADGAPLATTTHTVPVACRPNEATCSGMLMFAQSHIYYTKYAITLTLSQPLAEFAPLSSDLSADVGVVLRHGFIDEAYTTFEIGWKLFFIVIGTIILVAYLIRLITGPGSRDGDRKIIPSSIQQRWVAALGILLFFFNDPTFPSYITKPTLVLSGFYAVCSFTFIATLLLYWLVIFDLARLQGERGLTFSADDAPATERPGACFWVPKILLVSIFWTVSIAAYMYQRLQSLTDPTFQVTEAVGSEIVAWFGTFAAGVAGVYVLYMFALLVLSCRTFRTMRSSHRFVVATTLTALIVILCGLFLNAYTTLRETSAAFLSGFGAANLYVWALMLLHLPTAAKPSWEGATTLPDGDDANDVTPADIGVAVDGGAKGGDHGGDAGDGGDGDAEGDHGGGDGGGAEPDPSTADPQAERRRRVSRQLSAPMPLDA
jgi:hypothetical protein